MELSKEVSFEIKENKVAEITINRAESLNALNYEIIRTLLAHIRTIRETISEGKAYEKFRVLTIRGAGKAFVAGADIKVMHNCSWEEVAQFIRLGQRVMRELESLSLPVISVVDGYAIGGGLELALASDMIIASEVATLGQAEVNLGLIPGFGGTQRLALRTGVGRAKRLIFTGETIDAKTAYELGVVDYLFPEAKLEAETQKIIDGIVNSSPMAIAAAKRSIEKGIDNRKTAGLAREVDEFLEVFNSADCKEGLGAFVEKRKANFPGK